MVLHTDFIAKQTYKNEPLIKQIELIFTVFYV